MEMQVRSLPLDVASEMAGKSLCGGARCLLYSGCLLPQPSVLCSCACFPMWGQVGGGKHTITCTPSQLCLPAAKSTPSPHPTPASQRDLAGRLAWGALFRHQLVHKTPFWHLGLVMCLRGDLLLGNCQLKFEPDLGIAENCPG